MQPKPFYKSRKFAYALGTFLAALVLVVLPMAVELDPEVTGMLEEMLPLVFVIGIMLITGHTITDVMAIWREGVIGKELKEAAHDLIDALDGDAEAVK